MQDFSYSPTFKALLSEANFTKQMLGAGATQIRRAGYADKGIYFQAFTSLSTGLERIGKLCMMLDYYLEHQAFPDLAYMRREIGHQISLIHKNTAEIVKRRKLQMKYLSTLTAPAHLSIITALSEFALGDRYSNINLLVGSNKSSDPIAGWFERVDKPLFETCVSASKKEKIMHNAEVAESWLGSTSDVLHISETGGMITTMAEASLRTGIQEAVAPYRQFYVLQIIRYWVEVLWELQRSIGSGDIPDFGEVFAICYNEDAMFRSRKTWEQL